MQSTLFKDVFAMQELVDVLPVAIFVKDASSRFLLMNKACEAQWGMSFADLMGTDGSAYFPAEQMANFLLRDQQVFADGVQVEFEEVFWSAALQQNRMGHTFKRPVYNEAGEAAYLICITLDITDRKQMADRLSASEAQLQTIIQSEPHCLKIIDAVGRLLTMNPAGLAMIEADELAQVAGHEVINIVMPEFRAAFVELHKKVMAGGSAELQFEAQGLKGARRWLETHAVPIEYDGKAAVLGITRDISEKKANDELIWKQANFDALTGLPNRRMFHDRLEQEMKKSTRAGLPLALMFIDLDHFKEVNDTLGHDQGDLLLIEAARRIKECVRDTDTVARLGGDEFTVILPMLEEVASIERIAQSIIDKLMQGFVLNGEAAFVSASIGITLYPDDTNQIEMLLKNADQAMYVAKNAGRNRYRYFTHELQEAAQTRMRLTNDLRNALAQNQFRVYYQPIVEMATGQIHKAEALIRWLHPQRGMVSPVQFIPLAEESGLINQIGDWVFHETSRQVKHWRATHAPLFQISVNKSPVQFRQQNLDCHDDWLAQLKALSLHGQSISIEITEGVLLNAESDIQEKLYAFRDAGVQVAIDDFGTGYSSLAYLKKFDIDYLKIDQTFVSNLENDTDDLVLCEAIIVMAHKLGLKVIAEGVETEQQREILARAGCDYAQGFLYSKAVPPEEFELLLAQTRTEPLLMVG